MNDEIAFIVSLSILILIMSAISSSTSYCSQSLAMGKPPTVKERLLEAKKQEKTEDCVRIASDVFWEESENSYNSTFKALNFCKKEQNN